MNWKKTLYLLGCFCVITGFLCGQSVQAGAEAPCLATVVRSAPAPDAWVLGQLRDGTAVEVQGESGSYYRIDCFGISGYIAREQLRQEKETFRVHCRPDSPESRTEYSLELPEALELRRALITLAQTQLGTPYVYGGEAPGGFDCSGFTYYLYSTQGIELHRTASSQLQDGIIVPKEGLQPGDLVFFREPDEVTPASHVGIYAGDGQIIHAGRNGISYADLDFSYFRDYYLCARRLITTPALKLTLLPAGGVGRLAEKAGQGKHRYTALLPCPKQVTLP